MTDLGPGWTRVKFGDVVKLNKARVADPAAEGIERYRRHRAHRAGRPAHPQLGIGGRRHNLHQLLRTGPGALRETPGLSAQGGGGRLCRHLFGRHLCARIQRPRVLLPELLPFLCQTESFFEHAVGTSAGSLSPRTNWTQLANYEFALPPLAEQRRIAEVLWAMVKS